MEVEEVAVGMGMGMVEAVVEEEGGDIEATVYFLFAMDLIKY